MIIEVDNRERHLPDFFIVGAAKSATTSLFAYLAPHPEIFLPKRKEMYLLAFENREPQRFKLLDGTFHEKVGCDANEYFETYQNSPEKCVCGDASTWYLYFYETAIKNIKSLYGDRAREPKIIMVLRNPIDRAWSHYSMHQRAGIIDIPFREAILSEPFREKVKNGYYPSYDYVGFGMYFQQVKAYMEAFAAVKVLLFEDLRDDAESKVNDILQFLGLEPVARVDTGKRLNVSGKPRSGFAAVISNMVYRRNFLKKIIRPFLPLGWRYKLKMGVSRFIFKKNHLSPQDRQMLVDIYRDDILHLQELLDRDLSAWL